MNKVSQKQRNDLGENKVSYGIPLDDCAQLSGLFVFINRLGESLLFDSTDIKHLAKSFASTYFDSVKLFFHHVAF